MDSLKYNLLAMNEFIIDEAKQKNFREWLELNITSISWEGRYVDEFNKVWSLIFQTDLSIEDQFKILHQVESLVNQGPLLAWFRWLKLKLFCYIYMNYDISVRELSTLSGIPFTESSIVLRDFFIDAYPHLEELFNEKFHNGNFLSKNLDLKYGNFLDVIPESIPPVETINDVMNGMEVTLYSDWEVILKKLEEMNTAKVPLSQVVKDKKFIGKQLRFVQEMIVLFFVGAVLIFAVKVGSKWYDEYLVEKISLFEPNFFWLDKNLSFTAESSVSESELRIESDKLAELEKIESQSVFEEIKETKRYEVESDVVLTSVDTLPKDFEVANLEKSEYEEDKKGGYRNLRYGRRMAYRVMMTSVNPTETKKELIKLLGKYNVSQVDNVKPGTEIPGGIYFNLFVPIPKLKSFLSTVTSFEKQSTILESKTVFSGPSNSSKVFIWIKSI